MKKKPPLTFYTTVPAQSLSAELGRRIGRIQYEGEEVDHTLYTRYKRGEIDKDFYNRCMKIATQEREAKLRTACKMLLSLEHDPFSPEMEQPLST